MNLESIRPTNLHRSIGAIPIDDERCLFRVWAPTRDRVAIDLIDQNRLVPMEKRGGYHFAEVDNVVCGQHYAYRIEDGPRRPDPASRFQPNGVHGASEVVSRDFAWNDRDWRGIEKEDLIIYEMHVGTFTDEGTYDAARERLDELVDLGVTAVELMPVADSAGRSTWSTTTSARKATTGRTLDRTSQNAKPHGAPRPTLTTPNFATVYAA